MVLRAFRIMLKVLIVKTVVVIGGGKITKINTFVKECLTKAREEHTKLLNFD